ncbi:MAG: type II toxin-antitoxin system HicA family toxin [Desulfuromusa sp.]
MVPSLSVHWISDMGNVEKKERFIEKSTQSQTNIKFSDLCSLAELVGFNFDRQEGSHKIYRHRKHPGIMNFQKVKGKAKPYQVKQLLNFISQHKL